jgi:hypothetical protein
MSRIINLTNGVEMLTSWFITLQSYESISNVIGESCDIVSSCMKELKYISFLIFSLYTVLAVGTYIFKAI